MTVPRTDLLADVAAEDPVLHAGPQIGGDRPVVFDRKRADAPAGVEHTRLHEGAGRTGVEAGRAGAAVVHLDWRVGREFEVGQQRRQKKETARAWVDQHRVLAEPAEAGEPGKVSLRQRRRIDHAASAAARHAGLQPGPQHVHPAAEQVVIVGAPRIAGHTATPLPCSADIRGAVGARRMVGGEHDHAPHAGKQVLRIGSQRFLMLEPLPHHARKPLIEPLADQLPPRGRPGRGDAQPRKTHPDRLPSQFFHEQATVKQTADVADAGPVCSVEIVGGFHGDAEWRPAGRRGRMGWERNSRRRGPRGCPG